MMAINGIQFQKGMSLAQFMKEYGTEAQCEEALVKARWRDGFQCPRCAHRRAYEFKRGATRYWQCKACRYQSSLRAGTVMEHGQLPLTTWFLAIYLMTQSKTNIAALALMWHLGVSWKAAWLLKHKLMEVMVQREANRPLQGDVRADDADLGGERTGGGPGRGSSNKVAFVAAVELREGRPQRVRFDPVDGFSVAALTPWARRAIAPGSCVVSDGLLGFEVLERLGYTHKVAGAARQGRHRNRALQVAQCRAGEPENDIGGDASRLQVRQVCAALSGRGAVPLQSAIRHGRDAAPHGRRCYAYPAMFETQNTGNV